MSRLSHEESTYNSDQVQLWKKGSELLVRRGIGGSFPLGEIDLFRSIGKEKGFTPDVVRRTRTKAGNTLETLLHMSGDRDIADEITNIESIGSDPLEVFIGQLKGFFMGKGTHHITEYIKVIRTTRNPNAHPMNMKPLLHYLCEQYIFRNENKYNIIGLIENFSSLEGVDVNIRDFDDKCVLDVFDTAQKVRENDGLIMLLESLGADWSESTIWSLTPDIDGSRFITLKSSLLRHDIGVNVAKAIRSYEEQARHI